MTLAEQVSSYVFEVIAIFKRGLNGAGVLRNTRINDNVNIKRNGYVMATNVIPLPRPAATKPEPLGLYFRPGWTEHRDVLAVLESGRTGFFGAIFDPTHMDRQKELRERILGVQLDAVLDPRTQAAALPGGFTEGLGSLPWGLGRQHRLDDFLGAFGQRQIVGAIGDFALDNGFTAVIAPSHYIRTANDRWLGVDIASVRYLRNHLDRKSGASIPIFYSLAIASSAFRDRGERGAIIHALAGLPIAALWLKVDGFGSNATPTSTRIFIDAMTDFHELGIPIIGDQVGGLVGLSLLAFGSIGGIAHGITNGERFNSRSWMNPRTGDGFSPARRVYLPAVDLLLKPQAAKVLIEKTARTRAMFGCGNPSCCPRGITDMLQNPGRHFICQRIDEVSNLSGIPGDLRTQRFLDQHVRAATDKALAAANTKWGDDSLASKIRDHRKRLDNLRVALGDQVSRNPPQSFSVAPETRSAREPK
jgi:hypothetical protein